MTQQLNNPPALIGLGLVDDLNGPELVYGNRPILEELTISKNASMEILPEGVPKVNSHVYFCYEDSEFSEFSDNVADQEEEAEQLMKIRQKQRQKKRKAREGESHDGGSNKIPLEMPLREVKKVARRRKKGESHASKKGIHSEVERAGSHEVNGAFREVEDIWRNEEVAETRGSDGGVKGMGLSNINSGIKLIDRGKGIERQGESCSSQTRDPVKELESYKLYGLQGKLGFSFEINEDGSGKSKGDVEKEVMGKNITNGDTDNC